MRPESGATTRRQAELYDRAADPRQTEDTLAAERERDQQLRALAYVGEER